MSALTHTPEGAAPGDAPAAAILTRREFVGAALIVGALAVLPKWAHALPAGAGAQTSAAASPGPAPAPVVSFHMDQPYVDYTGTAEPFIPPAGAQSAASIAALDDALVFGTLRL
jgi:hypothetical protein